MFAAYLTNCLMWALGPPGLLEAPVSFAEVLTCVMCSRILLNVRDVHRQLEKDEPRSEHAMRDMPLPTPTSPVKSNIFGAMEIGDENSSMVALREHVVDLESLHRVETKTELTSEELHRLRRLRTK
jgi:hypothetical protein